MAESLTLPLLRIVHVLAGAIWVGAVVFLSVFLIPSIRAVGPAGAPVMEQLGRVRRVPLWMMGATFLTLLSGFTLYWRVSGGFNSAWMASGPGRVFGLGGLLALVAAVVGITVNSPAGRRMGEFSATLQAAKRPPTAAEAAEMQRLQARLQRGGVWGMWLVVLATVAMAVARYVP